MYIHILRGLSSLLVADALDITIHVHVHPEAGGRSTLGLLQGTIPPTFRSHHQHYNFDHITSTTGWGPIIPHDLSSLQAADALDITINVHSHPEGLSSLQVADALDITIHVHPEAWG